MDFVFIVNPVSGNGNSLKAVKVIEEYCKLREINYNIIYTKKKDDAETIAKIVSKCPMRTIFSVGGDGTLNEVVNGLANSSAKLGIIPAGTGNDFYRSFVGFTGDKVDLGKVNDKYFINVASIGLDADAADYANKLKDKQISSKASYILGLIHEYFNFKPINIEIGANQKSSTILTVCNAKYYGNGFKIAPKAILNDGMFDVVDVKSLNKLEIIYLIGKLLRAKHLEDKKVNFYRTDNLTLHSNVPLNCNVDGEIIRDTNFYFSIVKNALNVDVKNSMMLTYFLKDKKIIK